MSVAQIEREIHKLGQGAIADKVGLHKSHVSLVLRGKREPSFSVAAKIAESLSTSLDDFHKFWESRAAVN